MDRCVNRYSKNHHVHTRRARLRPETSFLAALVQEVNGRAIRRLRSWECGARQRPHTPQVFVNTLPKGRLIGRICIQAQGRFTHCSRPPSPPLTISDQNKSDSDAQWEPLHDQKVAFSSPPDDMWRGLEKSESHFDRNLSRD